MSEVRTNSARNSEIAAKATQMIERLQRTSTKMDSFTPRDLIRSHIIDLMDLRASIRKSDDAEGLVKKEIERVRRLDPEGEVSRYTRLIEYMEWIIGSK